mmetsp:Transcript_59859/g.110845  ORF Transcript_59859/g.110845 Transcript_59859/m.110845 type:complete len:701 (+) Transcript_59859:146-2248(+)
MAADEGTGGPNPPGGQVSGNAPASNGAAKPTEEDVPKPAIPVVIAVEDGLPSCQGQYELDDDLHNGRPHWRRRGTPDRFLFFSIAEKTWFISDELEDQGFDKAVTDVSVPLGLRWLKGSVLRATSTEEVASGDKGTVPSVLLAEQGLDSCNGEYKLSTREHNDRPVWRKESDPARWLFYSTTEGTWFLSDELEDQGFDKATTDTEMPLGMKWVKGSQLVEGKPEPPALFVAEGGTESCVGQYRLVATQQHNNRPVWKKSSKPERLLFFSQADKAWYISDELEDQGFDKAPTDIALPIGLEWTKGMKLRHKHATELRFEALAAVKAAVAEIRPLRDAATKAEDDGAALKEATKRLADALKKARLEGVSEDELLQASTGPSDANKDEEQLQVGDRVEVHGLESEQGKLLNGEVGIIIGFLEDKGRFQIQLDKDNKVISAKPGNLTKVSPDGDDEGEDDDGHRPLETGDKVEVYGLESDAGAKLNGRIGVIVEYLTDKERFKVQLAEQECVSVKPSNLRRHRAARGGASKSKRSQSPSESSSSSSRPKKKQKTKKQLSPEEEMERLLKQAKPSKLPKASRPPDPEESGPPDAADAAARAAGAAAAAAAAAAATEPLKPGDQVEVFGLKSAAGKSLNGKTGMITKFDKEKGRFQVELGQANIQSVKPENLRRSSTFSNLGGSGGGGMPPPGDDYQGSTAGYTLL